MKKILPFFKPYKAQALLGPLFKLLEASFELTVPFIVSLIVDKGLGAPVDGGYPNADKPFIFAMCGVLCAFGVVGLICAVVAQYFAAKTATGVSASLRRAIFQKLTSLSYADFDEMGTPTMLTRMTGDVNQVQTGINLALRLLLRSPFIVFGAVITAFFIDVKVALVFLGAVPVLAAIVFLIMRVTSPLYKKSQAKLDEITLSTRENLTGVRVIRAFRAEKREKATFDERNEAFTESREFVGKIAALTNPLTFVVVNLAIILLVYVGGVRVNLGDLSQGNVLALYNLMSQILIELIKLANLIVTIAKAVACSKRIEAVLEKESSLTVQKSQREGAGSSSNAFICFDRVSARYHEGGERALANLSLTAERGQTVGVIGGTGSGKSTLVNLLPRFYDVSEGRVCVDGKDVRDYDPLELRSRIGIVPQKATLFKGTIRDNLLWGNGSATDEELMEAARIAQAEQIIEEKGGLDSPVEQNGRNFSGGQKQRLTIARALVRRPEILILDDSSSALDYATDAALRASLRRLDYAPTVFVVSQRTSSVRDADRIVVLDEGEAVGIGTHAELLQTCAVYREIYDSQYKTEAE